MKFRKVSTLGAPQPLNPCQPPLPFIRSVHNEIPPTGGEFIPMLPETAVIQLVSQSNVEEMVCVIGGSVRSNKKIYFSTDRSTLIPEKLS